MGKWTDMMLLRCCTLSTRKAVYTTTTSRVKITKGIAAELMEAF